MLPHKSVLLEEALEQLAIKENGFYLDCTFGRGGHSQGILERLGESGRLLALDCDSQAVNSYEAKQMLKDNRFTLKQARFSGLQTAVADLGCTGSVDGILMDIGVSSPQLDTAERGFSFLKNGPLDMRMDRTSGISASDWIASVSEQELIKVLFEFGEERFARRIAKAIMVEREATPITTTQQLAEIISEAVPFKEKHKHPATRSFQAIRIAVNQELNELQLALKQAVAELKSGGRLVVISFHSLEDRIVKRFIRNESKGKIDYGRLPVKEADIDRGVLNTIGKAVKASQQEVKNNPRARSAIMRTAEKK